MSDGHSSQPIRDGKPKNRTWDVRVAADRLEDAMKELSHRGFAMMMVLESFARNKPYATVGNERLADIFNLTTRAVVNILVDLEQRGWILRECTVTGKKQRQGIALLRRFTNMEVTCTRTPPVADPSIWSARRKLHAPARRKLHANKDEVQEGPVGPITPGKDRRPAVSEETKAERKARAKRIGGELAVNRLSSIDRRSGD